MKKRRRRRGKGLCVGYGREGGQRWHRRAYVWDTGEAGRATGTGIYRNEQEELTGQAPPFPEQCPLGAPECGGKGRGPRFTHLEGGKVPKSLRQVPAMEPRPAWCREPQPLAVQSWGWIMRSTVPAAPQNNAAGD